MIKLEKANETWWRKPLVRFLGKSTTAELAILSLELSPSETGVWMNSRRVTSGVVDLRTIETEKCKAFKSIRESLPEWLSRKLSDVYKLAELRKGCPDLVIWNATTGQCRLVEVKCPLWDKISLDQQKFIAAGTVLGIQTKVVYWRFSK